MPGSEANGRRIPRYPQVPHTDHADDFHGIAVPDPFRWFDEADEDALRGWLAQQREFTRQFLDGGDERGRVARALADLPRHVPDRLAIVRQGARFDCAPRAEGPGLVLQAAWVDGREHTFDPADLNVDGRLDPEFVYVSPTGRLVAVGLVAAGAEIHTVRIWDAAVGRLLPDTLPALANPVIAWLPDETGFYYNRTRAKLGLGDGVDGVYRHRVGASPDADECLFHYSGGRGHAALPWLSPCGRYLLVKTLDFVTQRAGLAFRREDSREGDGGPFRVLFEELEAAVNVLGLAGDRLFVETCLDAPNGRVLEFDLAGGGPPVERIAETDAAIARTTHRVSSNCACAAHGRIAVTYLVDAQHRLRLFDLDGALVQEVALPGPLTVLDLAAAEEDEPAFRVATTTFTEPFREWRIRLPDGDIEPGAGVSPVLDSREVRVTQQFYRSTDGARIPLFLVGPHQASDQPQPVLMYGYGGWGSALTPAYRPDLAAWVRLGGTYAIPNIRGGGEYGEAWHAAGRGLNKPTAFDDFCAAAGHLVEQGVTTPRGLAIRGLSNGGLLVTACANRCPRLFEAAVAEVPLVDVVHLMDSEVGSAVAAELGDPVADPAAFEVMRHYSPLQNVSASVGRPAILVVPADRDRRAPATAAYKYLAALQASAAPGQLALLRLVEGEGHTGWPDDTVREVLIDELAFLLKTVRRPPPHEE